FSSFEFSLGAKWLELLREIAPQVTRVAILRDPIVPSGSALFGAIQGAALSLRVGVVPIDTRDPGDVERAATAFAPTPTGGFLLGALAFVAHSRNLIVTLAARHRLPAVSPSRIFVAAGGLSSYSTGLVDTHRQAAGYVDRILKGEKPADLPVQAPTK